MKYFEKIVDISTNEETIRPYAAEEIDEVEKALRLASEMEAELELKTQAKERLLQKLGITADEVELLSL